MLQISNIPTSRATIEPTSTTAAIIRGDQSEAPTSSFVGFMICTIQSFAYMFLNSAFD